MTDGVVEVTPKVTTSWVGVKPFTWSYSKLKNYESCPKRHEEVDVKKSVKEDDSDSLLWGNEVHKKAAARLKDNVPLPVGMEFIEPWCQRILAGGGMILVEQRLAISRQFEKCGYFDGNVWFRGVGDAIKIIGPVALIIDWKTGKILEDSVQLALNAACVFAAYPEVHKVRSEFIWLKHGASSRADFTRNDMASLWKGLWPRVEALELAHQTSNYPAKPGSLCKRWCPVKSCVHNGV